MKLFLSPTLVVVLAIIKINETKHILLIITHLLFLRTLYFNLAIERKYLCYIGTLIQIEI